MQSQRTILVVAPDSDLRRSLTFLLEAEGLLVNAHERLEAAVDAASIVRCSCAIIDDIAIDGIDDGWSLAAQLTMPKIILWGRTCAIPGAVAARIIDKPLLGGHLVEAVIRKLGRHVLPTTT